MSEKRSLSRDLKSDQNKDEKTRFGEPVEPSKRTWRAEEVSIGQLSAAPKDPAILQSQLEMQRVHSDVKENREIIEQLTRSNRWLEEMI